jgi:hypothetical protein
MGTKHDFSELTDALQVRYNNKGIADLCYKDKYFLKTKSKKVAAATSSKTDGSEYRSKVKVYRANGSGATIANAQTTLGNPSFDEWVVTPKRYYTVRRLDGLTIEAASKKGTLYDIVTDAIDEAREQHAEDLEIMTFLGATGVRGVVGSTSTTTLTLSDTSTAKYFREGMTVQGYNGASARTGSAVITAVDPIAGTLTTGTDWTTQITSLTAGDSLVPYGMYGNALNGLGTRVPITRSGSTTVQGVDLSTNWYKLAGYKQTALASVKETFLEGSMKAIGLGSRVGEIVCSYTTYNTLVKELGNNVIIDNDSETAKAGFAGIVMVTPAGNIPVRPATYCPEKIAYGLSKDPVNHVHWGSDLIFLEERGGSYLQQVSNDDAFEVRLVSYADMLIESPRDFVVFDLS